MQVQPMGGNVALARSPRTNIFDAPYASQVIVKLSSRALRRGDYPCGCRLCREAAVASQLPRGNPLAAIDVYDLPDKDGDESAEYFH